MLRSTRPGSSPGAPRLPQPRDTCERLGATADAGRGFRSGFPMHASGSHGARVRAGQLDDTDEERGHEVLR